MMKKMGDDHQDYGDSNDNGYGCGDVRTQSQIIMFSADNSCLGIN